MSKKIFFYLILITSILAFSCASKPKIEPEADVSLQIDNNLEQFSEQDAPLPDSEITEETDDSDTETDYTESSDEISESEESEVENDLENNADDFLIEEEKVEADELEDILEPEEVITSDDEPFFEEEPVVQDVPPAEENIDISDDDAKSKNAETAPDADFMTENLVTEQQENTENEESAETQEAEATDSEPETSFEDEQPEETENNEVPSPSRSLTVGKNQFIDIVYPGKGWIYQGNIDSDGNIDSKNKNFIFGGRKLGGQDQSFTLRSRQPGRYLLHFYKDDILTGSYIDDYLEIIVEDKPAESTEHITAPSYSEIVPPQITITADKVKEQQKKQKAEELKQENEQNDFQNEINSKSSNKKNQNKSENLTKVTNISNDKDEQVSTTVQTSESAPSSSSPVVKSPEIKKSVKVPAANDKKIDTEADYSDAQLEKLDEDTLLKNAQKLYEAKNYEKALQTITKFFEKASSNMDKGLYLQGQILEEKSPVQNIKDAVESYDLLVKKHPESSLSEKAKKRSIYLKRFYINIR